MALLGQAFALGQVGRTRLLSWLYTACGIIFQPDLALLTGLPRKKGEKKSPPFPEEKRKIARATIGAIGAAGCAPKKKN